ncbi:hypothetical protein [Floridanema aerugineum]|uniref:Uncharacterized protein n=1 Tax=Floridaenema aerugineum BLCC-F46 TaxID=3153654 RepID=A0ABV4XCN7_9CYAN
MYTILRSQGTLTRQESLNPKWQQPFPGNLSKLPKSFAEVVEIVTGFVFDEFDREITEKQLYYHNREHINGVRKRANLIWQIIYPEKDHQISQNLARMQVLLDLCANAHDLVQVFLPQTEPHTSRKREAGVSETLTIEKLYDYINQLNNQLRECQVDESLLFTKADLSIIEEAILATICIYEPSEQAIYQPALYEPNQDLSPIARILALADIGALGMEGITAYNQEGSLLFLEENPDVIQIIYEGKRESLALDNSQLHENIRQRLLKRAQFQINFAKSRLNRYQQEISSFSAETISVLTNETFKFLNPETIKQIEAEIPTAQDTPLEVLLTFFNLEKYISSLVNNCSKEVNFPC